MIISYYKKRGVWCFDSLIKTQFSSIFFFIMLRPLLLLLLCVLVPAFQQFITEYLIIGYHFDHFWIKLVHRPTFPRRLYEVDVLSNNSCCILQKPILTMYFYNLTIILIGRYVLLYWSLWIGNHFWKFLMKSPK